MMISFLSGLFIGVIYFGGLYYSTHKIKAVRNPGLFMALSLLIRMGILLVGLYYLAQRGYKSILLGFIGIMLIRFILVFQVRKHSSNSNSERK
ncbi:MAG TPA: ATP synthase subunit I [Clostridia bacterium]|nr:ATP synthase subunit I [Clostridia bacterium]